MIVNSQRIERRSRDTWRNYRAFLGEQPTAYSAALMDLIPTNQDGVRVIEHPPPGCSPTVSGHLQPDRTRAPVSVISKGEEEVMGYLDDAFDNLKSNLEITKTESDLAQTRHKLVRDHIESSWQLSDHFLTGSYSRQTKTKKLKDVDIFAVIDPNGPQGALAKSPGTAAIDALRDVLATRWSDLDTDDNVVTIKYGDEDVASYEVAPVFPREGHGYRMAEWRGMDGYGSTRARHLGNGQEQGM